MLRPATATDREAVIALAIAEENAWFGEPESSAEEIGEWLDEEGGVEPGVVALGANGAVCGFASPGRHEILLMADRAAAVEPLLHWVGDHVGSPALSTFAGDTARVTAFERHGLHHVRSSFTLARCGGPLPAAPLPHGVEVAPYRLGDDDEAVHRLLYVDAAWAAIEGHTERDLEAWIAFTRPCSSLFVARRDGRPVGWVAGRLLETGRGYVQTLAVASPERGLGLGRALLVAGLEDLRSAGATDLGLGVEAENDKALGLYRSVGFKVEREWRHYR